MGAWIGALPAHTGTAFRKTRKYIKRSSNRMMRRMGKKYGNDIPKRVISGWSD